MNTTIADINRRNLAFWQSERKKMERRMTHPAILASALDRMKTEAKRVPVYYQSTFEEFLAAAERDWQRFAKYRGQMGGKARRGDSLEMVIKKFVRKNPAISEQDVLNKLKAHQGIPPIQDVDEDTLSFTNHDGHTKVVKRSALKDRVSRAKKQIRSR